MFTFKRHPRATGLSNCAFPYPNVDIKVKKKRVGYISPPNYTTKSHVWTVRFMVNDPNGINCKWHWVTLKKTFEDEECARAFLRENFDDLIGKFDLAPEED